MKKLKQTMQKEEDTAPEDPKDEPEFSEMTIDSKFETLQKQM
jgi:hypothetical protein